MNKNAKRWVKALRSGEYKQGRKMLHEVNEESGDKFCCLGVACELALKAGVLSSTRIENTADGQHIVAYYADDIDNKEGNGFFLPFVVVKWLGLNDRAGRYIAENHKTSLTTQNDGGASFDQIADIIESEPEGLFEETVKNVDDPFTTD